MPLQAREPSARRRRSSARKKQFGCRFRPGSNDYQLKDGGEDARRNESHQITRPTSYATEADFCRIFAEEMNRLYLLSFLLTADHTTAEKCFVSGLEDSRKGNPCFQGVGAILGAADDHSECDSNDPPAADPTAVRQVAAPKDSAKLSDDAVQRRSRPSLRLPAFERFAFVMSVLEGYSDQECSLLLGCTRGDVIAARIRALQQIGETAELHSRLVGIESKEQLRASSRLFNGKRVRPWLLRRNNGHFHNTMRMAMKTTVRTKRELFAIEHLALAAVALALLTTVACSTEQRSGSGARHAAARW